MSRWTSKGRKRSSYWRKLYVWSLSWSSRKKGKQNYEVVNTKKLSFNTRNILRYSLSNISRRFLTFCVFFAAHALFFVYNLPSLFPRFSKTLRMRKCLTAVFTACCNLCCTNNKAIHPRVIRTPWQILSPWEECTKCSVSACMGLLMLDLRNSHLWDRGSGTG